MDTDLEPVCSPDGPSPAEQNEQRNQDNARELAAKVAQNDAIADDPVGNGIIGALGGGVAGFFRSGLSGAASLAMKGSGLVRKTLKALWDLPNGPSSGSSEGPGSSASS